MGMEFNFESNLEYQNEAIESICELFSGQESNNSSFPIICEFGVIGNELTLSREEIYNNLRRVQKDNNIRTNIDEDDGLQFSVEMETGTGKTYVYLKSIFELYKKYNFKKFIIIVPSVAIKRGVIKTLEVTRNHFKKQYDNVIYDFYEYQSSKIDRLRQFSRSNNIEIMVITLDSFNKDSNVINKNLDKLNGDKPINLISSTNPFLILDEPQNMESDISKDAIDKLEPSAIFRYSATHKKYYNLIYRLTPVEAYNKNLVKKIEVLSVVKDDDFNNTYIKCIDIKHVGKRLKTQLEVYKKFKDDSIKLSKITFEHGDEIYSKTNIEGYKNLIIEDIDMSYNVIRFSNGLRLKLNQEIGADKKDLMKEQIKQTIVEHFEKQLILKEYGIKVLSLFFIDAVANYLDDDGFIKKTFEEEFNTIKRNYPEFEKLDVNKVHKGYFSKMKKESSIKEDNEAFELIMKNKERLLSFEEETQFIFSHSALNEGWDNPNVFNICTLNNTISNIKKRQEIGRGVRLPVNQEGDRIKDIQISRLTVIANESYVDYVSKLQTEYIDYNSVDIKEKIKNSENRKKIKLNKGFELDENFKNLWSKISKKTKYNILLNDKLLIEKASNRIADELKISKNKIKITKSQVSMNSKGVDYSISKAGSVDFNKKYPIPNIVEIVEKETNLSRNTITQILISSNSLNQIYLNPQEFISQIILIIKTTLRDNLVNGIQYTPYNDNWRMELFKDIETYNELIFRTDKSIYKEIELDSTAEEEFAKELEEIDMVKLYIKMPRWFKVDTPIGPYNPDWAIVVQKDESKKEQLYFVRETKKIKDDTNLRPTETMKIECAKEHFKTIDVDYNKFNVEKEKFINELY